LPITSETTILYDTDDNNLC